MSPEDRRPNGSPPRVRGKHLPRKTLGTGSRITPACAGKTMNALTITLRSTDHPRVCGENDYEPFHYWISGGSPPRVRGKQNVEEIQDWGPRITPACAGKTLSTFSALPPPADHPRVCGENIARAEMFAGQGGSPPRVRGKRSGDES